jgi:ABC-type enterochelin transport system permease subunit
MKALKMRKAFEVIFLSVCFAIAAFIWVGILTENRILPPGVGGFVSALLIAIGLLPMLIKDRNKGRN